MPYAMLFNGLTTKISAGTYDTLIGDKSISCWFRADGWGESSTGRLLDNTKLLIGVTSTSARVSCTSDASTTVYSAASSVVLKKWTHLIVTRTTAGVVNFYINGALSGTANQASGTPVAGSDVILGNNTGQTLTFNGIISSVRIIDGILTTQEIAQLYTSEKAKYNI